MIDIKEKSRFKYWTAFGYLPAIKSGLSDAIQPAGLTSLILFFIFMYWLLNTQSHPVRWGRYFILGVLLGKISSIFGNFDGIFDNKFFWLFMEILYICITILCLTIGLALFRDWQVLKEGPSSPKLLIKSLFGETMPVPQDDNKDVPRLQKRLKRLLKSVFLLFFCFSGGIIVALISSAFPEDASILYIIYEAFLPGGRMSALSLSAVYGFFFILPLLIFLSFLNHFLKKIRVTGTSRESFSIARILFSGVFLAYGIGMAILIIF